MLREFSAGAVVLRHMQNEWWMAVIEPGCRGEPEDRKDVIALPKGNIDPGEKPEQAARREVMEETGLRARTVARLADIKYVYTRNWAGGQKVFKLVSFYLMKYQSGRINGIKTAMRHEVRRAYWLPLAEAAARLTYSGEKAIARKARAYVKAHSDELA